MPRFFRGLAVGVVVGTAAVSMTLQGCAPGAGASATTETSSAKITRAEPTSTAAEVLVVHGDVAARCLDTPPARRQRAREARHDDAEWRAVLERVTRCMKTGALRGQKLLVKGDDEARAAVGCVLSKMGIAESRIDLRPSSVDSRIEIALSVRGLELETPTPLTLAIDRSAVVAFLSDDNLD
jgi:hypothetical protein